MATAPFQPISYSRCLHLHPWPLLKPTAQVQRAVRPWRLPTGRRLTQNNGTETDKCASSPHPSFFVLWHWQQAHHRGPRGRSHWQQLSPRVLDRAAALTDAGNLNLSGCIMPVMPRPLALRQHDDASKASLRLILNMLATVSLAM
eukprot:961431-Rhodomonas_salina.1